jgi:hypothetical protein
MASIRDDDDGGTRSILVLAYLGFVLWLAIQLLKYDEVYLDALVVPPLIVIGSFAVSRRWKRRKLKRSAGRW